MSFQSFTVECPSCTSILRVQDPALIGTIANCPRCGSMVQITPIEPSTADSPRKIVAGAGSDSQAITEDALPQDDATSLQTGPSGFDGSHLAPPPVEPIPESPSAFWESESTQKKRRRALIATVSGCGLLIAVLVFSWFVRGWSNEESVVAEIPAAEIPIADRTKPSEPASDLTATENNDTQMVDVGPAPSENDNATAAVINVKQPPDAVAESAAVEVASTTPMVPPTSLIEPWRVDGENLPPAGIGPVAGRDASATPQVASGGDQGTMMELPPGLAEFLPLMDLEVSNFDLQPTLKTPQTLNDVQINAPAEELIDPMMIANPPEPIELDRALAVQMTFDSSGTTLTEFSLLLSQLTGVPIQLDWVSFDIAGQNIDQSIAIPKGWMPAAEVIDAIAKNLNCEARQEKSFILFTFSDEAFEKAYAPVVSLDDFGDGTESAGTLLVNFLRLTGDAEAPTQLAAIQSREDKQLAAFAVDALRRMRGIEPKINDERFQRWAAYAKASQSNDAAEFSIGQWPPLKDKRSIEQLIAPETVAAVLRMTAKVNDTTCLINAEDTRRRGLSPKQLVMPFSGISGEEMLAKMLAPFRMQVRQVDASHWWVGTEATYDRLPVVIWTEPLGDQREGLIERFQLITANEIGSEFRLAIDDTSDKAIMLLPRFIARQLNQLLPQPVTP